MVAYYGQQQAQQPSAPSGGFNLPSGGMPKAQSNPITGQPLGPKPAYVNENVPYLPNDAPNPWYKGNGSQPAVNNASPQPGQIPTQPYGEPTQQNPQWLQPSQATQQSQLLGSLSAPTGPSTAGGVPTIDLYRGGAPKQMTQAEQLQAASGAGPGPGGAGDYSQEHYGLPWDDSNSGIYTPTFQYDPGDPSSGYPEQSPGAGGGVTMPTFENPYGGYDPSSGYPEQNPSVGGGVMMPTFQNPLMNPGGGITTPTFENPLIPQVGGGSPSGGDLTSNLPALGTDDPTAPGSPTSGFDGNLPNINTSITPQIVYDPELTAKAGNQILATQAQQSDPRWLMKQFSSPGRSMDAGTAAATTPYLAQGQFLGNQGYANLMLGDTMANQESLLAGEMAREKEAMGLGNLLARLQEQGVSRSGQLLSPLLNSLLE